MGRIKAVQLLVDHRASLRAQDDGDFTALHWAVARGHEQVARALLGKKASIRSVASDGLNPLQRAFSDGSTQHTNLPMVDLLLEHGADPSNLWDPSKVSQFCIKPLE